MRALFRKLREHSHKYSHLVEVQIIKDNLIHNLNEFRNLNLNMGIAPVLKSNAYGHGLIPIAKILDKRIGIPFFVVDSYYEAAMLRNEHIVTPILVLGYTLPENIAASKLRDVAYGITSLKQLKDIAHIVHHQTPIHIKVDTGMHRQGLLPEEITEAIKVIKSNSALVALGLCSHFADADGESSAFTHTQGREWKKARTKWEKVFPETKYYHLANTAGSHVVREYGTNVARVGIGLYGFDLYPDSRLSLKPVLEMHTILTGVKKLKEGDKIGYNVTFTAQRDMTVATIPVGYFEGVDRRLSNVGSVYVKDTLCKIVGRVSMNITSVDVSDVSDAKEGDSVVVISSDPDHQNSIEAMAEKCGTIPYVLLVHIPSALRRTVV